MKKIFAILILATTFMGLAGCVHEDQATRMNRNIVNEANDFGLHRRLAVINLLDGEPLFELTGFFSLDDRGDRITVTVQSGPNSFERHMINVSEFVFWVIEDVNEIDVDPFSRTIIIRPDMLMNFDIDVR